MTDAAFKTCPFCKEQIRQEAVKCRFCGEWLERRETFSGSLTAQKPVLPPPTAPQQSAEPSSLPPSVRAAGHHRRPRGYMTACTNCRRGIVVSPLRDKTGRVFCSSACLEWFNGPRTFCKKCLSETIASSSHGLPVRINGIGITLMGFSSKCATCGSVVRREVITIFFLPVFPLKRYRVLYVTRRSFYSRQMKE